MGDLSRPVSPVISGSPASPMISSPMTENRVEVRETWGKKVDFLLSVIGFAVDLANVWRFPYLCYKNGGGAFMFPYLLMLCFGGIPLFYMELALGQYIRKGAITCWGRLVPLLKGIGFASALIALYVDFYYNVIIAWALRFFFASFTSDLPWTRCGNVWNTDSCREIGSHRNKSLDDETFSNYTQEELQELNDTAKSPAEEYFFRYILELQFSDGIDDLGNIRWEMALCLLAVYVICFLSLRKGISTSGKVVWFTALFPYVVLIILLIRGVTLPGALQGITYYLEPNFDAIWNSGVWVDAATQVFFSLGPGFGVLIAYASYNPFHNNVYRDALLTSCINSLTSILSGFVIFSVLGYMSHQSGKPIDKVATEGPGLVFIVYPEAISTMPGSTFFALIFFMMLLTLGLDSSFGGSEAVITGLSDEFPILKRHRQLFVAFLFTMYFFVGLASCSQGGFYFFTLLDTYAAGYSILFAVFFESLAISWIYGINRFSADIYSMMGFYPGRYWRFCWKYVAPIFLVTIMTYGLLSYKPLKYGDYEYPVWANVLGWCIALSSMLMIPGVALGKILVTPGTLRQRIAYLTTPWKEQQISINGVSSDGTHIKLTQPEESACQDV